MESDAISDRSGQGLITQMKVVSTKSFLYENLTSQVTNSVLNFLYIINYAKNKDLFKIWNFI